VTTASIASNSEQPFLLSLIWFLFIFFFIDVTVRQSQMMNNGGSFSVKKKKQVYLVASFALLS